MRVAGQTDDKAIVAATERAARITVSRLSMIQPTPTPATTRVTLLPQERELRVSPEQSILDAALDAGINLPHSCKGGHCGSCRARIVQGAVQYPNGLPLGLSADEAARGYALLCQARAASATLAIEVRDVRPPVDIQPRSLPCRVEKLERLATNVMAMFLRVPSAESFTYLPGQYLDILLPGQRRRSFSIANAPGDASLIELHIARVDRGEFTQQVFESLRPVRCCEWRARSVSSGFGRNPPGRRC